jgi:alkylation response protein AidB-like acyl-CoA dehydrogenase
MALDFELSEEQKTLYAGAKEWAQENFDFTLARKWDEEHQHPRELWSRAAKLGYVAPTVEPKYGGQGIGVLDYCLILEAFTSVDLTCGMTMYTTQFGSEQIERFGTEEQKMKYLTKTCGGEWVCCAGYTEPNAGSDLQAITTRATRDGNEWVINGEKIFATNSPIADWGVFLIRTSPRRNHEAQRG